MNPKVFMIGWEYPPHNSGGLGVACQGLTEAMAQQGSQIYFTLPYNFPAQSAKHMQVLSCTHPDWENDQLYPPFLAYDQKLIKPQQIKNKYDVHELSSLPQSELEHKVDQYSQVVEQQAHHKDFEVIHAHDWMSLPAAAELKNKTGKPMVAHIHSTEYDRIPAGNGSPFITHSEYQGMQFADRVVAVSFYTKQLLIHKYNIPAHKIDVVHNGMDFSTQVDPGTHHFAHHRPVVAFMGRLTGQKGADYFLQLANQTLQKMPQALFVVAGHGDMYHQLLWQTARQGLSTSVLFSGFVRDQQKNMLLDRADIFVMPSLSEPFGLVALEAAQHHTPVIVSKNSGVKEVLPSAIQVDFWDVNKMSQTIIELLTHQTQTQLQVKNQLQELKNVTWQKAALDLKEVYRKAFLG